MHLSGIKIYFVITCTAFLAWFYLTREILVEYYILFVRKSPLSHGGYKVEDEKSETKTEHNNDTTEEINYAKFAKQIDHY